MNGLWRSGSQKRPKEQRWSRGGRFALAMMVVTAGAATAVQAVQPAPAAGASPPGSAMAIGAARLAVPSEELAALPDVDEPRLRQALFGATWPADMVRLADAYLQRFEGQPWAPDAASIRQRAEQTARLLRRSDVQLYRSSFAVPAEPGAAVSDDLHKAALGDASAAFRLAQRAGSTEEGLRRRLGWLQLASVLGSHQAAYELALIYRRQAQPLMASVYEYQAIEGGYQPLPSLDHRRK